ncbi:branched-chain alpha-keto acid dehydrogenase subunit E2 [Janibacter sp. Soil728]|uniref:dihydrolipoamide acetyltransferase family protein n=1 Tax=Janibacter sp. Soil728 TaxID=1736393 RepID=UPI0006F60C50|nr:dihydrolipoamide acetyltransferase family protein [Janibacter sp. Soil728]KRE39465.1 branched-chain alpha-keto acid dehydrogenase subunit E2 [Janibacter sp. Soil728]
MAVKNFNLPDPGEGLTEAEITTWKVKVGDEVAVNDIVIEVETAKSLVELPIPFAGKVVQLLAAEGDTVDVGAPIIAVEVAGSDPEPATPAAPAADEGDEASGPNLVGYGAKAGSTRRRARKGGTPTPASAPAAAVSTPAPAPTPAAPAAPAAEPLTPERTRALAKPPVRKLAKDLGLDLQSITPSGEGGIVTRADVEAASSGTAPTTATSAAPALRGSGAGALAPQGAGAPFAAAADVRVPIKGVRKATAAAMVSSAFTAPHVTEFVTVDVTAMMEMVERLKKDRAFKDVKVTPLLIVAKAFCLALRRHHEANASWDEAAQEIVLRGSVNLGIAAATPRGLLVPNIKAADQLSLHDLAGALGGLVATAREGRTQPADLSGGTATITNVGVFGVDTGTPILNPGEATILAFGAVRRMPWVVTAADGSESIEPRWVTQLALSFDHRLVDGELGSKLLADVAALLHDPGTAFLWA